MQGLFQKMGLGPRCCMSNGLPGDAAGPLFIVKGWPSDSDSLASNSGCFFFFLTALWFHLIVLLKLLLPMLPMTHLLPLL